MPKMFQGICHQCGREYKGRGQLFCGKSCCMTYSNLTDNPASGEQARRKISLSRIGKPTSTGLSCPPEKKARISAALIGKPTGRKPTPEVLEKFAASGHRNKRKEANPNWRGGTTPIRLSEYNNPEYLAFVNGVLRRDNYTCQDCGCSRSGDVRLEVHHVIPYAECHELRYDISNGLTLCVPCHNKTKRGHPRPKLKQPAFL